MSEIKSETCTQSLEIHKPTFKRWLLGEPLTLLNMVVCAMLLALGVVLKVFSAAIPLFGEYSLSLGLATIPVIFAGTFFGPVYGLGIGALADFLGYIVKPIGGYFPGFTISMALMGLLPALFLYRKQCVSYVRTLMGVIPGQVVGSMALNSWFLIAFLGRPAAILPFRLINQVILIPVYALVIYALLSREKVLRRILRQSVN